MVYIRNSIHKPGINHYEMSGYLFHFLRAVKDEAYLVDNRKKCIHIHQMILLK